MTKYSKRIVNPCNPDGNGTRFYGKIVPYDNEEIIKGIKSKYNKVFKQIVIKETFSKEGHRTGSYSVPCIRLLFDVVLRDIFLSNYKASDFENVGEQVFYNYLLDEEKCERVLERTIEMIGDDCLMNGISSIEFNGILITPITGISKDKRETYRIAFDGTCSDKPYVIDLTPYYYKAKENKKVKTKK